MKCQQRRFPFMLLICIVLLTSCSNRSLVTDESIRSNFEKEQYPFSSFSLTIDTERMQNALAIRLDNGKNRLEAAYENKLEEVFLHGDEAIEKIEELFANWELDPEARDEDLVKEAADAVQIKEYKTLKLDVEFTGYNPKKIVFSK